MLYAPRTGGKVAVVDVVRQAIEVVTRHGGKRHVANIPIRDLVDLVDPEGTTYQRSTLNF